jgi:hypothetical protein
MEATSLVLEEFHSTSNYDLKIQTHDALHVEGFRFCSSIRWT